MVLMTQSLERFLITHYPREFALIGFGHMELFTEEMQKEYLIWCSTEEGRSYLKGGSNYDENHEGSRAYEKALAEERAAQA